MSDYYPIIPGAKKEPAPERLVNYMADRQPSHSQNYAREIHDGVLIRLVWAFEVRNCGALVISDTGISIFGEDDINFDKEYLYAVQK
jgi:hypothetical protein